MTERRIAIDPGFGGYKVAEASGDKVTDKHIPSVVGRGTIEKMEGTTGLGGHRRPISISFDAGEGQTDCLVGDNVSLHVPPIERTDFDMLSGSWEQRALTYAALYRLLGAGEHVVRLVVALPVQVLSGAEAKKTARQLEHWLLGEHTFTAQKRQCGVEITQVLPRPQPLGAFFEWGLNDEGLWARSKKDLARRVGVLDIGFNTLDLLTLQEGKPVERFTGGDQLGMSRPAALLANRVQREWGRRLSLHEVDALLQDYQRSGEAEVAAGGEVRDVSMMARDVLDQWAGEVVAYLGGVWGNDPGFATTIITGGGAPSLEGPVKSRWGGVEVLRQPVTANARGLAKYARRDGIWKS